MFLLFFVLAPLAANASLCSADEHHKNKVGPTLIAASLDTVQNSVYSSTRLRDNANAMN